MRDFSLLTNRRRWQLTPFVPTIANGYSRMHLRIAVGIYLTELFLCVVLCPFVCLIRSSPWKPISSQTGNELTIIHLNLRIDDRQQSADRGGRRIQYKIKIIYNIARNVLFLLLVVVGKVFLPGFTFFKTFSGYIRVM